VWPTHRLLLVAPPLQVLLQAVALTLAMARWMAVRAERQTPWEEALRLLQLRMRTA
jgi:hypothetical protein